MKIHGTYRLAVALVLLATFAAPTMAQTLVFTAAPTGGEVVPPTASNGFSAGSFVIDREADTLTYRITVRNLTGTETATHLHGFAPAGQNAAELLTLPLGKTKDGVWTYPESMEEMLVSGEVYVDVHTDAYPAGELRGQLARRADDYAFTVSMSKMGAQGSNSPATGSGYMYADTTLDELRFGLVIVDLQGNLLQSHIHAGGPGVQGPVLFLLPQGFKKFGKWDYPESEEPGLLVGDTYVNCHTQTFLNGEIRGQIEPAATNPQTYCVAKPSGLGCQPAATWTGTPTAGGTDDLVISATGLPNQLGAHFFWAASPKQSPFFGGTLCVRGPLHRTPLTTTGGTPGTPGADCTGAPSFFLSQAYMAQHGLTPGTLLYGQWWYLDPATPGAAGVGLSDAVQLEIRP